MSGAELETQAGVAPGLLLAMPQLQDPNFERAVVLMVEHSDRGSFGLVLNRPTPLPIGRVLETMSVSWSGDPEVPVWTGGPVNPRSGWILHEPVHNEAPAGIEIAPGLMLSTSPDQLRALAADPPERLRFLMGYSGWGGGQLEGELAQGAWLHAASDPDLIFESDPEDLWEEVLRSIGIEPGSLVPGTGVH